MEPASFSVSWSKGQIRLKAEQWGGNNSIDIRQRRLFPLQQQ